MRRALVALILIAALAFPLAGHCDGEDAIMLARALYTLGRNESGATRMMIGSVIMNRVDNPWYPDDAIAVISQPHQFACGSRYDERTLGEARALLGGARALPADVVNLYALDASALPAEEPMAVSGNYAFYY